MEIGVEFLKTVIADQTILIKLYEAQITKLNEQIQALITEVEELKEQIKGEAPSDG